MTAAVKAVQTAPAAVQNVDYYAMEEVCASELFPDVYQPGQAKVKRRVNRHPDCLPSNPDYVPDAKTLRRTLAWWFTPRLKALGLYGETGTGKTEMLLYIADRLNEPCYIVKVHPALMPEDLEGCKDLAPTTAGVVSKNSPGLAAKAYRNGGLLVLDEVDKANAALGCALHGLVEGKPWPIEQFNIVLNAHPMCRVAGTANTMGEGGHERYHTSNRMDQALRSRFGWLQTHFPDNVRELSILTRMYGKKIPTPMLRDKIKLANAFRDALLGPNRDGKIDNPLNAVFSTRTLVQWCNYCLSFGPDATWRESLDFAFWGSVDPECEDMAKDIIQRTFGSKIDELVRDVVAQYTPKP